MRFESEPQGAEVKTSGQTCRTPCELTVQVAPEMSATFALNGYQPERSRCGRKQPGDWRATACPQPGSRRTSAGPRRAAGQEAGQKEDTGCGSSCEVGSRVCSSYRAGSNVGGHAGVSPAPKQQRPPLTIPGRLRLRSNNRPRPASARDLRHWTSRHLTPKWFTPRRMPPWSDFLGRDTIASNSPTDRQQMMCAVARLLDHLVGAQ